MAGNKKQNEQLIELFLAQQIRQEEKDAADRLLNEQVMTLIQEQEEIKATVEAIQKKNRCSFR